MVNGSAKCSTDELFLVKKMRNFISIIITFVRINFHSDPEIPHCKDKKRATDSLSLSQQPLYISHRRKGLPFPLSLSLVLLGFLENRTQILLICQNKPVLKNSIFFFYVFKCRRFNQISLWVLKVRAWCLYSVEDEGISCHKVQDFPDSG